MRIKAHVMEFNKLKGVKETVKRTIEIGNIHRLEIISNKKNKILDFTRESKGDAVKDEDRIFPFDADEVPYRFTIVAWNRQ